MIVKHKDELQPIAVMGPLSKFIFAGITTMKLILSAILMCIAQWSSAQPNDLIAEQSVIKETLYQFLNTNPNSPASYLRGNKGYQLMENAYDLAKAFEKDSVQMQHFTEEIGAFYRYSDTVSFKLQTNKIKVDLCDTLYAYEYVAVNYNLKTNTDWDKNYIYLLADFEENKYHRFDTTIGKDYIDLLKQQIHYKGQNIVFDPSVLNNSYYEFKNNLSCDENDAFCIKTNKIYRPVFNADYTRGCYLFSFLCGNDKICRSFIFIKKENGKWLYVADYPSWIIDEA